MLHDHVEELGPYLVYEQLGSGGMATVHRAELRGVAGFRRTVALKQLHPHLTKIPEMLALFAHEAQLASYVHHANVAQMLEFGSVAGVYYIAMEYVPGPTLAQLASLCAGAAGPMPILIVLGIVSQLCDALDHVHNLRDEHGQPLGIVHRDVSPANVIISSTTGTVTLIDFGIAKAAGSQIHTQQGLLKGKLGYLAPEYLRGRLDARADLFGLGVIAHELLANRPLFLGRNQFDTLTRLREMPIPSLSRGTWHVPRELDEVVMRALQRNPDLRWQTARAMKAALSDIARSIGGDLGPGPILAWTEWALAQQARGEAEGRAGRRDRVDPDVSARTRLTIPASAPGDAAPGEVTPAEATRPVAATGGIAPHPASQVRASPADAMPAEVTPAEPTRPVEARASRRVPTASMVPTARPDQSTLIELVAARAEPVATRLVAPAQAASGPDDRASVAGAGAANAPARELLFTRRERPARSPARTTGGSPVTQVFHRDPQAAPGRRSALASRPPSVMSGATTTRFAAPARLPVTSPSAPAARSPASSPRRTYVTTVPRPARDRRPPDQTPAPEEPAQPPPGFSPAPDDPRPAPRRRRYPPGPTPTPAPEASAWRRPDPDAARDDPTRRRPDPRPALEDPTLDDPTRRRPDPRPALEDPTRRRPDPGSARRGAARPEPTPSIAAPAVSRAAALAPPTAIRRTLATADTPAVTAGARGATSPAGSRGTRDRASHGDAAGAAPPSSSASVAAGRSAISGPRNASTGVVVVPATGRSSRAPADDRPPVSRPQAEPTGSRAARLVCWALVLGAITTFVAAFLTTYLR